MQENLSVPAPYPPDEIRRILPPQEWQACLETWILCVEARLRVNDDHFEGLQLSELSSGFPFLKSYFISASAEHDLSRDEVRLRRCNLLLLRRLLIGTKASASLASDELFDVLANASRTFPTSRLWRDTLLLAWKQNGKTLSLCFQEIRVTIVKLSISKAESDRRKLWVLISQVTALVKCTPPAGRAMMTGSDYLDSLVTIYDESDRTSAPGIADPGKALTENLSICLTSLVNSSNPSLSTLVDVLYELKTIAEDGAKKNPKKATLLSSLVCLTTFVHRFEGELSKSPVKRGRPILNFLTSYKSKMSYLHPLPKMPLSIRQTAGGDEALDSSFHQLAGLAQLQDLFPEAAESRLVELLALHSGSVEAATSALLEQDLATFEALPEDSNLERGKGRATDAIGFTQSSYVPKRSNKYDGDDFDNLAISASQIHQGRKNLVEDNIDTTDKARKKAAILSALATFDSDEDERDDTYDVADVGGALDNTVDTDARKNVSAQELTLFKAWKSNPEFFARDTKTRMSQPRRQLRRETGMDNEQLEGWAIMLSRDPSAVSRLEAKHADSGVLGGQQKLLKRTKWSNPTTDEDTDTGEQGTGEAGRGRPFHRGFSGRGGLGRGGSTAGPADDVKTQNARRRKEQGRGRGGANHNRREGRARKMGRGFGAAPTN